MQKYGPLWQQRELDRALAQLRPTFDILNSLPPSYLESVRQMESLSSKFSLPPAFLSASDEIQRVMNAHDLNASFPAIASSSQPMLNALKSIQEQMASVGGAFYAMERDRERLAAAIAESFVGSEAILRLAASGLKSISVLTKAQRSFEQLAIGQLAFPHDASDIFKSNTVDALAAAAFLLPDMARVSELSALMGSAAAVEFDDLPDMNVFEELFVDLARGDLNDPNFNAAAIVEVSPSATVVDLGGRLVKLVYDLNTQAERSGEDPVFKPTSRAMLAFHVIPTTVAVQEGQFEDVVDHLFFLLYEGSGTANRLTSFVDKDKLDALWLLKSLRLGARHDLEHGAPGDMKKKSKQVGDAYRELIGSPVPKSREDWLMAQHALYQRLVDMLEHIWRD